MCVCRRVKFSPSLFSKAAAAHVRGFFKGVLFIGLELLGFSNVYFYSLSNRLIVFLHY